MPDFKVAVTLIGLLIEAISESGSTLTSIPKLVLYIILIFMLSPGTPSVMSFHVPGMNSVILTSVNVSDDTLETSVFSPTGLNREMFVVAPLITMFTSSTPKPGMSKDVSSTPELGNTSSAKVIVDVP